MDREYKFKFTTPGGSCQASAGSPEELAFFVPAGVINGLQPKADDPQQRDLESVAIEVLESLRAHLLETRTRSIHTVVSDAGLELALIKCYLRGLTICQAVGWLKSEHGFECSTSAVGRYWKHLRDIGVIPTSEILPAETQTTFRNS